MSKKIKTEIPSESLILSSNADPEYTLASRVTLSSLYMARQREIAFLAMSPLPTPVITTVTSSLNNVADAGASGTTDSSGVTGGASSSGTGQSNESENVECKVITFTQRHRPIRVHQRVAPHLRRRAASHNPHRLRGTPALRALALQEGISEQVGGGTTTTSTTRRHKRRQKKENITTSSETSTSSSHRHRRRVLVTHVWHAKRAQMRTTDTLWGNIPSPPYALAYTFSMKGFRSLYRTVRRRAVLYDTSYSHVIVLSASNTAPLLSLCDLILRGGSTPLSDVSYVNGSLAGYACAYDCKIAPSSPSSSSTNDIQSLYPRGAIGPVIFLWSPLNASQIEEERSLWLFTHPTVSHFLADRLRCITTSLLTCRGVQVTVQEDVFVCYELLGPTSGQVLIRAFALHDAVKEKSSSSMPETQRSFVLSVLGTRPSNVSPGIVLVVTVTDPRLSCLHSTNSTIQSFVKTTSPSPSETMTPSVPPRSPLWNSQNLTQFQPTLSTHAINQLKAKGDVSKLAMYDQNPDTIPVLLIRHPVAEGWLMVAPRSWGLPLWMALVMHGGGVRVIGLQLRNTLTWMWQGRCVFPSHFPDTLAYKQHSIARAHQMQSEYNRRPPAKRTNFERLGVTDPFRLDFSQLFDSPVDVWVWRSPLLHMFDGQSVCALAQFYANFTSSSNGQHERDIELFQLAGGLIAVWVTLHRGSLSWGARVYKCDSSTQTQNNMMKGSLLGFVVEGGFHFDRGIVVGLAFCSAVALLQYNRDVVVVQNRNSLHVHQAQLTICACVY